MAGTASESLAYAVRGRVVVHFHGESCLALTGVAAVPALFAAASDAWRFAAWVATLVLGGSLLDSMLQVLSGVSTGGLSTHDDSLVLLTNSRHLEELRGRGNGG